MREATVRQLQIFDALARHQSFSRAAEEMRLTQPAVSMQVRQLERLAGLPLLERSGRRLRLTQAGEEMLRCARQVLQTLQGAEESFAALRGLDAGRIRFAVVSTAKYFAPKLLALFARRHRGVEMRLEVHNRDAVVRLLAANEVDLALMGTPPERPETVATPFARHPLVVIAHPHHPLVGRRRVTAAVISAESFLVREPGSGTRAAMERFFDERAIRPASTVEIASDETIKQAVMAGLGLGFLSRHSVALELAARKLALVKVEGLPVMRDWYMVHRRERRLSPAAEAFEAFVVQEGGGYLRSWLGGDDG